MIKQALVQRFILINIYLMKGKDKKEKKDKIMPCQVCFHNSFEGSTFQRLVCTTCSVVVHRNCYSPDSNTKFRCDQCKNSKFKDPHCSGCGANKQKGILKYVGNDEWMHVLCAFSSQRTHLSSYKTLNFLKDPGPQSRKVNQKNRCIQCNFQKVVGQACSIQNCTNFSHLVCLLEATKNKKNEDEYGSFFTIGLLNKHQNSLISYISKNLKDQFKGLQLLEQQRSQIRYFVCSEHNQEQFFEWCPCNKQDMSELKECERCSRWFHQSCDNFETICSGCSKNNIYVKNLRLCELVEKAIQAEKAPQLDKDNLKFLDHLCLKPSELIIKAIAKQQFQVERYYLRKALQNAADDKVRYLEILYYLTKKQIKPQKDIATQDIQEIISILFGKNSKYQVKDKTQKVQKKYKDFLQKKLASIQKDGTQDIKVKLHDFIQKNKQLQRSNSDIAKDIYELVVLMNSSEGWKVAYGEVDSSDKDLIELFYELNLSIEETASILQGIKIATIAKQKKYITEEQYQRITNIVNKPQLEVKKKNLLVSTFNRHLQGIPLRKLYRQKKQIRKGLQQKIKSIKKHQDFQHIQKKIHQNNLHHAPTMRQLHNKMVQACLIKRAIQQLEHHMSQHSQVTVNIFLNMLLKLDQQYHVLSQYEKEEFRQLDLRREFYLIMGQKTTSYKESMASQIIMQEQKHKGYCQEEDEAEDDYDNQQNEDIEEEEDDDDEEDEEKQNVRQKKKKHKDKYRYNQRHTATVSNIEQLTSFTLKNWNFHGTNQLYTALRQLNKLAVNKVQFSDKFIKTIHKFAGRTLKKFERKIKKIKITPTPGLLQDLYRIAQYSDRHSKAKEALGLYSEYCQWKEQLQNKFADIPKALQNFKACTQLLKVVQAMLSKTVRHIDLKKQMNKLKAIKLWALLSLKLIPKYKATINSIQQTKALMDKLSYPQNELRSKVEVLDLESRDLNKKIGCVLQKPKPADLEIYEEISTMTSRMSLEEGFELKNSLQISELDVQIQLEALIQEMNQFNSFPKEAQLKKYIMSQTPQNVQKLIGLRRKIFENAFRFRDIGGYYQLVMRIIEIKCDSFKQTGPKNRREYFMYLNFGKETGTKLYQRTINRCKAYKEIEKAQKHFFQSKYDSLLPPDCKKMCQYLDPLESAKVARWSLQSQVAKSRVRSIKSGRHFLSQLQEVEYELLRIPINNRQTLNQIKKIKKQLNQLTTKVKNFTKNNDNTVVLQSPYTEDIIRRYLFIEVRTQFLDNFQLVIEKNRAIMEFGRNIKIDNYIAFSKMCTECPELANNNQVYRVREEVFYKIAEIYLRISEPRFEIGYTLLGEGGCLLKYPTKTTEIIHKITEINFKFNLWQPQSPSDMFPNKYQGSEHGNSEEQGSNNEDIQDQQDQDEDEDEDELIDQVEDVSDFEDYSSPSQSPSNRKRPRPYTVVELDDD